MGLFHFLIVVQGIIAAALVGVILMQRSEGGGLGMGGSPSGLMSARGAADFLTRTTAILASAFVLLAIALAFVAASNGGTASIDDTLKRTEVPAAADQTAPTPAETAPPNGAAAPAKGATGPATSAADKAAPASTDVPLDK